MFSIYNLIFGDKTVRAMIFRSGTIFPKLWKPNHLSKHSGQQGSQSDWFGSKYKCKISGYWDN